MIRKPRKPIKKIRVKDLDAKKNPKGGKEYDVSTPKFY